jgi:predicted dehydrogenase
VNASVAVVGAGAWGQNHVRTLHGLHALGGVVESSSALRIRVQQDFPGVQVWPTLEEALPHVQGCVIATPPVSHAQLAVMALKAGKGVLVEKPMTMGAREAEDLLMAAEQTTAPLMVGHLLMYQPAVQKLKACLDEGIIGTVYRIHQERLCHGRVRDQESVLWSFAPHDVAVLLYLLGGVPTGIKASAAAFLQPNIPDDVHLELTFENDRSAHVHAGWYWPGKRRGLTVFGEFGMIVYDEADQSLTLHRKHLLGGHGPGRLAPADYGVFPLFEGHGEPLVLEDQHFLDCLATGGKPLSDGQSGLDVVRVLERADIQIKKASTKARRERS